MNRLIIMIMLCVLMPPLASAQDLFAQDERTDPVFVIVLDGSGSMQDPLGNGVTKMSAAKQALKAAAGQWSPNTRVSLFVFTHERSGEVYPLSRINVQQFNEAVDAIEPGGGTPLGTYMRQAAQKLIEAHRASLGYAQNYKLIVVTDGETQGDEAYLLDRVVNDMMGRAWTFVDVLGVGMQKQHTLATKVNRYRDANDPDKVAHEIKSMVAETVSASLSDEDIAPVVEAIEAIDGGVLIAMAGALSGGGDHDILTDPQKAGRDVTAQHVDNPPEPMATTPNTPAQEDSDSPSAVLILIMLMCLVTIGFVVYIASR